MNKYLFIAFFTLVFVACKPQKEVSNHTTFNREMIFDKADILTDLEEDKLQTKILNFEKFTTNQIAMVTIDSLPKGEKALSYARKIANELRVGQYGKDNGLLILVSKFDRKMAIVTGYGTEKILTDAICKDVINNTITPQFKKENYFLGFNNGLDSLMVKWR